MDAVLVLNAGSSSIKFAGFESAAPMAAIPRPIFRGRVAQAGGAVELSVKGADGNQLEKSRWDAPAAAFDHQQAMRRVIDALDAHDDGLQIVAVGHRVVHGGQHYSAPERITPALLRDLHALVPLAPLHQPHNLKAIEIVDSIRPAVPQVACFDTAFHSTQSHVARAFALPREITESGVRRYGFHGLSYEYIASQLPRVLGDKAGGRVIVLHLGNGASLCALQDSKSVASTMGFSALDGLMMGTRCGALDPGVVLYLLQQLHMGADQVSDLLYSRSGLLGVSGISSDMQVLLASSEPRALEAVDLFVHRIVCEIGSLAAAMGGVDALVFTAGIGENAAPIRARVCDGCAWLGAVLDDRNNRDGRMLIHAAHSALLLAVVPTDEEEMIATHTLRLLR